MNQFMKNDKRKSFSLYNTALFEILCDIINEFKWVYFFSLKILYYSILFYYSFSATRKKSKSYFFKYNKGYYSDNKHNYRECSKTLHDTLHYFIIIITFLLIFFNPFFIIFKIVLERNFLLLLILYIFLKKKEWQKCLISQIFHY